MKATNNQLPSRGKFGESHVGLSFPTVEDIRNYLQASGKHFIAQNMMVDSVCDTDMNPYPIGDRDYLFVQSRSMINPNPLEGRWECGNCEQMNKYILKSKDIHIYQLPDDFESPSKVTLPISKEEIRLTLLTVEREKKLNDYLELHETADDKEQMKHSDLGEDLETFATYAVMIVKEEKIEELTVERINENIEYLRKLDYRDFEVLILFDVSFRCGPDLSTDEKCSNCGRPSRVRIKIDQHFFGISLKSILLKHRFLNKASNVGFQDFLKYTVTEMNEIVESEVSSRKKASSKVKKQSLIKRK